MICILKGGDFIRFLTEDIIQQMMINITAKKNINFIQQQAELFVLNHIMLLAKEGKMLTIDQDKIKMWDTINT